MIHQLKKVRHYYYICVVLLLLNHVELTAQGWEHIYGGGGNDAANAVAPAPDGGMMAVGTYNLSDMYFIRTDAAGNTLWTKVLESNFKNEARAIEALPEGGYIVAGYIDGTGLGKKDIYLVRITESGDILWTQNLGSTLDDEAFSIKRTNDGGFIIAGYSELEMLGTELLLIRTDAAGNEIWQKKYGNIYNEEGRSVAISPEGGFIAAGISEVSPGFKTIYILKVKENGSQQWGTYYGLGAKTNGYGIIANPDTTYVVAGAWGSDEQQAYMMKVNANGIQEWQRFFGEDTGDDFAYGICKTNDGYLLTGYSDVFAGGKAFVVRTDNNGNAIWERRLGKTSNGIDEIPVSTGNACIALNAHSYAIAGLTNANINNGGIGDDAYLIKLDSNGNALNSIITGSIFQDINNNCEQTPNEGPLQGWLVKILGTQNYFGTSDINGIYNIPVDSGSYEVTLIAPNDYWQPCVDTYSVNVTGAYDTLKLPFAVHAQTTCPYMTVDVSTGVLEHCNTNTYSVNYCNLGTYPALGAFIEITFDDDLTVTGSSLPWSFQNGNTYIFNIGNVFPGVCANFQISADLSCEAPVGAAHCVTAHIFPDSLCNVPSNLWDGSSVSLSATCENDSIQFLIKNIGQNPISNELNYIVIEDLIIGLQGVIPPLNPNESITVAVDAAGGATFRMVADQSPGHPGNSHPTVFIEGCSADGSGNISTGYVTVFGEDDADPFIDSDCQTSSVAIAAMSKRGFPTGYGTEHYIMDSTDLEYIIAFENTTLDTVKTVTIIDTLTSALDAATFVAGASSHPYQFQVAGSGVIRWVLDNINLPPTARGFVKFRISQKPFILTQTLIRNHAAVYLDFLPMISTDTTTHRVGENYIEVISKTNSALGAAFTVSVFPNPFTTAATLRWLGEPLDAALRISNAQGQVIAQTNCTNCNEIVFERAGLTSGVYFFQLLHTGKQLATGKIIITN